MSRVQLKRSDMAPLEQVFQIYASFGGIFIGRRDEHGDGWNNNLRTSKNGKNEVFYIPQSK